MKQQTERLVWVVVVLATAGWGWLGNERNDWDSPVLEASPVRSRDRMAAIDAESAERKHRPGHEVQKGTNLAVRSKQALCSTDPLARVSGFAKILASSDASNIEQVTAAVAELKASGLSLPVEEDLMHFRTGQLKGAELMAGRNGSAEDFSVIDSQRKQYEGWIQADPGAASGWLDALPPGKYRDLMAVTYITASTGDDPAESLPLVSSLHPSQQDLVGRAMAKRLAQSASAEEASVLFRTLESNAGGSGNRYLSSMFDALATTAGNGNFAMLLVESHLDEPYVNGSILARVSETNAKTNPEEALRWAVSMEGKKNDLPVGGLVAAAIGGMTLEGLESARQWAATQQDGAGYWLNMIERRRELLEDRTGDDNEYDRDD